MAQLGAGVRRISWHALRHTFASQLVSRGAPMRAVQHYFGHSTVQMTERYAHLAPDVLHDAIRVIESGSPSLAWATGGQRSSSERLRSTEATPPVGRTGLTLAVDQHKNPEPKFEVFMER